MSALPALDALLAPVSAQAPAGDDTTYDGLDALERLAGAAEPDWHAVRAQALALWARTRDLRVAVSLTRAALALDGLAGLSQGLALVAGLLSRHWACLHPALDAQDGGDGDDATARLSVLAHLADPQGFLPALRGTVLADSREGGRFTLRELEAALGQLSLPAGRSAPDPARLQAAWRASPAVERDARCQGLARALAALDGIEAALRAHGSTVDLSPLRRPLQRAAEFVAAQADATAAAVPAPTAVAPAPAMGLQPLLGLATRADAERLLEQVSAFLRRTEPSSPAPLFVDRAVRLLRMDFAAIVGELMPESLERVALLGGVALTPPEGGRG